MIVQYIIGGIILLFGFVVFFGAPYVPSQKKYIRRAFDDVYKLSKKDHLVDIGSGDGVVLRVAAQYGAKATGYEINPALVGISRLLSLRYPKVTTKLANAWTANFPDDTTIVYIFSVRRDGRKITKMMQRESQRLNRPLKLLCYGNPLHTVEPDKTFEAYELYTFRPLQGKKPQV